MSATGTENTASTTVVIAPARGLTPLNLHELWEYRELLFFMLWRDVKGRYRQMALGPLWMILNPVVNMVLFTVLFSMLAKFPSDGIPYPVFNYAALLPWNFFSGCLFAASNSLLMNRDLISKIYFPRLITPLVGILSALVDFAISFVILLGLMWYYGYTPGLAMLALPLFLLLAALTGLAVGLWAAAWTVRFRDMQTLLGYATRVWMYATPVVYSISMVPAKWLDLYRLNPMTSVIEGFRWCLFGTGSLSTDMLVFGFAVTIPLTIGGAYYFRRTERSIVDIA